jgi:hypothetical protein
MNFNSEFFVSAFCACITCKIEAAQLSCCSQGGCFTKSAHASLTNTGVGVGLGVVCCNAMALVKYVDVKIRPGFGVGAGVDVVSCNTATLVQYVDVNVGNGVVEISTIGAVVLSKISKFWQTGSCAQ